MDFKMFTQQVSQLMCDRNSKYDINITTVRKNNSVKYTGLTIRKPSGALAPVIYLEPFYSRFRETGDMEDVIDSIMETYQQCRFDYDTSTITDFDLTKNRIVYELVNEHRNRELLADIPHRHFIDDIAVTYRIQLDSDDPEQSASIMVTNSLMTLWSTDEKKLWNCAKENTAFLRNPVCISMEELLLSIMSGNTGNMEGCSSYMFVLTNTEKIKGAAVIANNSFMQDVYGKIGEFFILPSSIHEVIAVPTSEVTDIDILCSMVREVNATELSEEDILSDLVYRYDGKSLTVA